MESNFELFPDQEEALKHIRSGSVLHGGTGSGKSCTGLVFYKQNYKEKDLYIVTTAKKRDLKEWDDECKLVGIAKFTVISWNVLHKYKKISNAFFIFDEQRAIGYGKWGLSFIIIAKYNDWIMLTATPGDQWMDYMPLFIANGFYKHKTEFVERHVEYDGFTTYPKIKRFHNVERLEYLRRSILVPMHSDRHTVRKRYPIFCEYDKDLYKQIMATRVNIFKDPMEPTVTISELIHVLRHIVAQDQDRQKKVLELITKYPKVIIFYNFNYELDILKQLCESNDIPYSEYNGRKHEAILDGDRWVYLLQYTSGSEAWNCTLTDRMIFYSPNYAYRTMDQSEGRIDRRNTPYLELHYYWMQSHSNIEKSIMQAVKDKKKFNEITWAKKGGISTWQRTDINDN